MVKLAVIADDLTGALDTGIKFSKRGINTRVFTRLPLPFNEISGDTEGIIIDTETRHKSSKAAGGSSSNWFLPVRSKAYIVFIRKPIRLSEVM